MAMLKAGWLFRDTGCMYNRWRRSWFVLTTDGMLRYYEDPNHKLPPGGQTYLTVECSEIISGILDLTAPENRDSRSLFTLVLKTANNWNLCAESEDDMKAWIMAINSVRTPAYYPQQQPAAPSIVAPVSPPTVAAPAYYTAPVSPPIVTAPVYYTAPTTVLPVVARPAVVIANTNPVTRHFCTCTHHPGGYCFLDSPFTRVASPGVVLSTPATYTVYKPGL